MPEEDVFNDDIEVATDIPENAIVNEYRSKISIGDVETLDYGESAYVTNTGTPEDPVLNFGLPKGASGTIWGQLDGTLSDQADLQAALDAKDVALSTKANIASPSFTGIPTAPTATSGTSSTQIATTAFVQNAISILQSYVNSKVNNVLGYINFSGVVNFTAHNNNGSYTDYTVPSKGYVWIISSTENSYRINGKGLPSGTINTSFIPVYSGDKIRQIGASGSGFTRIGTLQGTFFPAK